ncbi:MAG: HipA domain-containing protein, partial [Burkholderiales bacterium]
GGRLHFASAMTLLERNDGDGAATGASYIELAELLMRDGAQADADLDQLWRRIVFSICVSNVDDHLRNHGFMLTPRGWRLAPAYDMNPAATGDGLTLNVSETDNAQSIELALSVAPVFRLSAPKARTIGDEVIRTVRGWRDVAATAGASKTAQSRMARAFRLADA